MLYNTTIDWTWLCSTTSSRINELGKEKVCATGAVALKTALQVCTLNYSRQRWFICLFHALSSPLDPARIYCPRVSSVPFFITHLISGTDTPGHNRRINQNGLAHTNHIPHINSDLNLTVGFRKRNQLSSSSEQTRSGRTIKRRRITKRT